MSEFKLTSKAFYKMKNGSTYTNKVDLTKTRSSPVQFRFTLSPDLFGQVKGDFAEIAIDLNSQVEPTAAVPAQREAEVNGSRFIRIRRSGRTNQRGLAEIEVALIESDTVIDSVFAVAGAPDRQAFRPPSQSKRGSQEPLPEGVWDLGMPAPQPRGAKRNKIDPLVEFAAGRPGDFTKDWPSESDGLGPVWVQMTCRVPTERTAIGFHVDNNSSVAPGTDGCVGIVNDSGLKSLKRFVSWFDSNELAPKVAIVDWGLGTFKP